MSFIYRLQPLTNTFDWLEHFWESSYMQKRLAVITLVVYLLGLVGIELKRQGLMPEPFATMTPYSHFEAIHLAFTLILCSELLSLIFSIASSFSSAVGKQFEILALILLRNAFKELSQLPEPIHVAEALLPVGHIILSAVGALLIFIALGLYANMDKSLRFLQSPEMRMRFIMSKKILALCLFIAFSALAVRDLYSYLFLHQNHYFFETVYTILIFADIALVLISQRYMPGFYAVFRNSGFVIGTLLMRLALSAPSPWDTAVSVIAAIYVLALTWATGFFVPRLQKYDAKIIKEEEALLERRKIAVDRTNSIFHQPHQPHQPDSAHTAQTVQPTHSMQATQTTQASNI